MAHHHPPHPAPVGSASSGCSLTPHVQQTPTQHQQSSQQMMGMMIAGGTSWLQLQHQQQLLQNQQITSCPSVNYTNYPLNRLFCCLLSGLPNDMEFGLRVTSLLADSRQINWISDYRFLEILLDSLNLHVCHCSEECTEDITPDGHNLKDIVTPHSSRGVSTTSSCLHQDHLDSIETDNNSCDDSDVANETTPDGDTLSQDDQNSSSSLSIPGVTGDHNQQQETGDINSRSSSICGASISTGTKSPKINRNNRSSDVDPMIGKSCFCFQRFWSEVCNDELVMSQVFEETDAVSFRPHMPHVQQEIRKRIKRVSALIRTLSHQLQSIRASDPQPPYQPSSAPCSSGENNNYDEMMDGSDEELAPVSLIKFVALLLSTDDQEFLTIGLDIMSSITEGPLDYSIQDTYFNLLHFIYSRCVAIIIESPDVDSVQKSLDVMTRVASTTTDGVKQFFTQIMDQTVCHYF